MHDPIWTCRDGRRIRVGEMTDSHLANSIAKIQRSANWRKGWLPRLQLEETIRRMGLSSRRMEK
jgi:hypothetical protein